MLTSVYSCCPYRNWWGWVCVCVCVCVGSLPQLRMNVIWLIINIIIIIISVVVVVDPIYYYIVISVFLPYSACEVG